MVTHSSILAWETPWTEEPGGLQFMGSQRVGHNSATKQLTTTCIYILYAHILGTSIQTHTHTHIYTIPKHGNISKYEEIKCIFFTGNKFGNEEFQCTEKHTEMQNSPAGLPTTYG